MVALLGMLWAVWMPWVAAGETTGTQNLEQGPWGEVEYSRIFLEPPDFHVEVSPDYEANKRRTVWGFPGKSRQAISRILEKSGIAAKDIELLMGPLHYSGSETGAEIYPTDAQVLGLSPVQRGKLYQQLATMDVNKSYSHPFMLGDRGFDTMSMDSGLSAEKIKLITDLCYQYYGPIWFADISLVMRRAADDEERWRILKTLRRQWTMLPMLKISPQSDLELLSDYWGARGRNKDALPILRSVAGTEGVESLDVIHLLPPTPRKLINTYGSHLMAVGKEFPNCYWTAFNFFAYEPSNRFLDMKLCNDLLIERFERATKPWEMGDLILITNPEGEWIHACNYVAGNIVFTKNGYSTGRPWVFEDLSAVLRRYLLAKQVSATFYRLKPDSKLK